MSSADAVPRAGPPPPGVRLRAAVPSDAEDLGRVHVDAWRVGYRTLMPQGFLDGLDPVARAAWWTQVLRDGPDAVGTPFAAGAPDVGDRRVLVAEVAGGVRGFAIFGTDHESGADGRVYALNVDPPAWGRGLGRALLAAAEADLAARGWTRAVLWVLSANTRARRCYERAGWSADGRARVEDLAEGVPIDEVRYVKRLT